VFASASVALDDPDSVTLFQGSAFCRSDRAGDVDRLTHGLFMLDRRVVSRWVLLVDGHPLGQPDLRHDRPYAAVFVGWAGRGGTLLVTRRRYVGNGLREDVSVRNLGRAGVSIEVQIDVAADFADIFSVKHGRSPAAGEATVALTGDALVLAGADGQRAEVRFTGTATLSSGGATWKVELGPGQVWRCCGCVSYQDGATPVEPDLRCGQPIATSPAEQRRRAWQTGTTQVSAGPSRLQATLRRCADDLGALRLSPGPGEAVVAAAGAPWYMTVFGRDALLTGWMALPLSPDLAYGALEVLADRQGSRRDPLTEEQPGRILHEVRADAAAPGGSRAYYGTVDATPMFVMLLAEAHRWGMPAERVAALLPAADAAVEWLRTTGDRDGYLTYTGNPAALMHQGWKDSADGVLFADGSVPRQPIALSEVQGYTYAAFLGRAELADAFGQPEVAIDCRERAARLRAAFNRDFWLADRASYAMALDGAGRQVDAVSSNVGHCLWTGIVDRSRAPAVAESLLSPGLFSGWGLRTLGTTMTAYDPLSYHNGSVWPHDTAIAVAGLARYGLLPAAQRLGMAVLDAAAAFGGRPPELFAGVPRTEGRLPATYPSSCAPQAWASAAPWLVLRSLLRLEPDVPAGRLGIASFLPPALRQLQLHRMALGRDRVDVTVADDGGVSVVGAGGLSLIAAPASPPG